MKKQKAKPFPLRMPPELYNNLHKLHDKTGFSINAICIEILEKQVKKYLQKLED